MMSGSGDTTTFTNIHVSFLMKHKVKDGKRASAGLEQFQSYSQEPRRTELLRREDGFEVWHLKASRHGTPSVSWLAANIDTQSPNRRHTAESL